ncbi:MAG: hypothetical protein PHE24_03530 [Patescibacteria group bacterium]|nr:hypothetical protein [Patescibacteria group bacterium]
MSIVLSDFSVAINYRRGQFTVGQAEEFINGTINAEFADRAELEKLIFGSLSDLKHIASKNKITADQELCLTTSAAGRKIAELVLKHDNDVCNLIIKGGWERGMLI